MDHPRLCGEQDTCGITGAATLGSPPPTRGTADIEAIGSISGRITPAYAGNRIYHNTICFAVWDHPPRLRGEQYPRFLRRASVLGSPPPTRGTVWQPDIREKTEGITPAYAGNSAQVCFFKCLREDHPRLRGEQRVLLQKKRSVLGSPPPTRGTEFNLRIILALQGITPAYAGNSSDSFYRFHRL